MWTSIECVFIDFRGCEGTGASFLSVSLVPRFYAVLSNYAKYVDPPLGWGHVIFMPIFGSFDVTLVTWALCLILIGRENFCCAVIGWDLLEPLLLLTYCRLIYASSQDPEYFFAELIHASVFQTDLRGKLKY